MISCMCRWPFIQTQLNSQFERQVNSQALSAMGDIQKENLSPMEMKEEEGHQEKRHKEHKVRERRSHKLRRINDPAKLLAKNLPLKERCSFVDPFSLPDPPKFGQKLTQQNIPPGRALKSFKGLQRSPVPAEEQQREAAAEELQRERPAAEESQREEPATAAAAEEPQREEPAASAAEGSQRPVAVVQEAQRRRPVAVVQGTQRQRPVAVVRGTQRQRPVAVVRRIQRQPEAVEPGAPPEPYEPAEPSAPPMEDEEEAAAGESEFNRLLERVAERIIQWSRRRLQQQGLWPLH